MLPIHGVNEQLRMSNGKDAVTELKKYEVALYDVYGISWVDEWMQVRHRLMDVVDFVECRR
jgi:hypothetical protein